MTQPHPHTNSISVHHVTISYQDRVAVHDVTGVFEPNSLTAIVGPNGGGKSTFIKALNKQITPQKGHVKHPCTSTCDTAYLPQKNSLDFSFPLTCYEVVGMGLWPKTGGGRSFGPQHMALMEEALEKVGLKGMGPRLIGGLSGGQAQRLLFARIILQDASLIILDEPFTAIDTPTCRHLMDLILDWYERGKTIIVALHNLDLVKLYFPQTVLLARSVVAWGPTASVLTDHNLSRAFQNLLE